MRMTFEGSLGNLSTAAMGIDDVAGQAAFVDLIPDLAGKAQESRHHRSEEVLESLNGLDSCQT